MGEFLLAQDIVTEVEKVDKAIEIKESKKLENRLKSEIKSYLKHDNFMIKAKVWLEKHSRYKLPSKISNKQDIKKSKKNYSVDILTEPPLPGLPSSNLNTMNDFLDKLEQHEQLQKKLATKIENSVLTVDKKRLVDSSIEVIKKSVKLVIDQNTDKNELAFLKELLITKADLDLSSSKADILDIKKINFPKSKDGTLKKTIIDNSMSAWIKRNYQNMIYAVIALVLFIAFVSYLFSLKRKKTALVSSNENSDKKSTLKRSKRAEEQSELEAHQLNLYDSIKDEIVNISISDVKGIKDRVQNIYKSQDKKDLDKIYIYYDMLGDRLFKSFFTDIFSQEEMINITDGFNDFSKDITIEDKITISKELYGDLHNQKYASKKKTKRDFKPFAFLDKLSEDQIAYLLKIENNANKAVVISQLKPELAAKLMAKLPKKDQAVIASEISSFKSIPVEFFQGIANKIAKNAQDIPQIVNLAQEGDDIIINILDRLDYAEQIKMLNSYQEYNPDLYFKIKRVFMTFDDLVKVPKNILKDLLKSIDNRELAYAFANVNDNFKDGILNLLPPRQKAMIESVINHDKPSKEDSDSAKLLITQKARLLLKSGLFSLDSGNALNSSQKQNRSFAQRINRDSKEGSYENS
jgi:flagellar motor switch protein FliG